MKAVANQGNLSLAIHGTSDGISCIYIAFHCFLLWCCGYLGWTAGEQSNKTGE